MRLKVPSIVKGLFFGRKKRRIEVVPIGGYIRKYQEEDAKLKI